MTTSGDLIAIARKIILPTTLYSLGSEVRLELANFDIEALLESDGITPLVKADCSEAMQAVCWYAGVFPHLPDLAYVQAAHCRRWGTSITVAEALATPGALLFKDFGPGGSGGRGNHVAMSLGDKTCIEARTSKSSPNCGIFNALGRGWNYAAKVPGVDYNVPLPPPEPPAPLIIPAILYPGQSIGVNQPLDAGPVRLILQSDQNLVMYDQSTGQPVWASNTLGSGADRLDMQGDGNLVLYAAARAVGATMTVGQPGAYLAVQGDRNAVIYTPQGHPIWASQSSPWIHIPS